MQRTLSTIWRKCHRWPLWKSLLPVCCHLLKGTEALMDHRSPFVDPQHWNLCSCATAWVTGTSLTPLYKPLAEGYIHNRALRSKEATSLLSSCPPVFHLGRWGGGEPVPTPYRPRQGASLDESPVFFGGGAQWLSQGYWVVLWGCAGLPCYQHTSDLWTWEIEPRALHFPSPSTEPLHFLPIAHFFWCSGLRGYVSFFRSLHDSHTKMPQNITPNFVPLGYSATAQNTEPIISSGDAAVLSTTMRVLENALLYNG